ncbi:MAG TPA: glycosyltransferase family 39 protein [Polyangiaceae bacterium]|jgi:hypothetical protein
MTTNYSDESSPLLEVHRGPALTGTDAGERSRARQETSYGTLAVAWVATATLVRWLFVAPLPLGNGEAYYWSWSRFLDWSYYDHPPVVAWMVKATTVFGSTSAAVRLGPILCAGLFGLLFYRLAERIFRPRTAFFALVLVTALPVFLASSFILNPEAPLAPLWVGCLLAVERMRSRDEWWRPLVAGALLGLAFLAKYTGLLLVPAVFGYLVFSAPSRRWLRRPSFYAGGSIALLLAMPVILWNQARGWPSLQLQLVDRVHVGVPVAGENTVNELVALSSSGGSGLAQSLLRVFVGQLMAYSPLLAPLLAAGIWRAVRRTRSDDRYLFLAAFTVPVLVPLLAAMTKFHDAEQHWTMMALVPAIIVAGRLGDEYWDRAKRLRGVVLAGVALSGLLFVVANVHARTTALLRLIPADHYDPRADMVNELVGWDRVRASLTQVVDATPGSVVLASNHYSMCGRMMFEMDDAPAVYCPTAKRSAYDFFERRDPPADATVVALTNDIHTELPEGLEGRRCTLADTVDIQRGDRLVARYFVQSCAPVAAESQERASRD